MTKILRMLPTFLLLLVLLSCAIPKYEPPVAKGPESAAFASHATVALHWEKVPTETDFGSFLFQTYKMNPADGIKVASDLGDAISILLWMPSMGHGSSPVTVEHLGIGQYRASNVFFIMKGAWEIHFQVKNGDASADEAVLSYTF